VVWGFETPDLDGFVDDLSTRTKVILAIALVTLLAGFLTLRAHLDQYDDPKPVVVTGNPRNAHPTD
jgi:hypothetical protein